MRTESTPPAQLPRPGFLPGLLGAIVLMAALALIGTSWFTAVLYVVCILALIMIVLAVQGKRIAWAAPLAVIAVIWNPVVPISLPGTAWIWLHLVAAVVFIAVGVLMRVPVRQAEARNAVKR
jgi:hypothetical protein